MDNETDGADECQPTTSNTNVRIKVSSWVTNFVSEMRTKSPAVVQKWVDSLPNENVTQIPCDTVILRADDHDDENSHNHDHDFNVKNNLNEIAEICETNCQSANKFNVVDITEQINQLNAHSTSDTYSDTGEYETDSLDTQPHDSIDTVIDNTSPNRRLFWQKTPSILSALRIRPSSENSNRSTDTEDLNALHPQLADSNEPDNTTPTNPTINKSKLNDFYYKLSINKKRYNFLKDRKMEAKKLLNNAKSRFLAATNWDELKSDEVPPVADDAAAASDEHDTELESEIQVQSKPEPEPKPEHKHEKHSDDRNEVAAMPIATAAITQPEASGTTMVVCDTIDMDLSADEFSRLSQSNDMLSADDEDSFNVSMPSINDGHATHLNVSRKIAMADIGRSTSDNPRLRNKFYLADIGRSFSEHQDDGAIIIGERNISAPSSSIAIQNNNRSNGNFYERRSYSVSPTQRGLKRGVLSRDHSLSDSSRHYRNQLSKGSSFQSDSSHCSSVESLLDARKPDSEAILRQLGFGPAHQEDLLSRIPKRFLKPSQVPGIDTEAFMRQQQIASNIHEQSILGYRGLTGNPHVLPSVIVAKIMERFQLSDEKNSKIFDMFNDGRPMSAPPTPGPNDLTDIRHPEP